MPDGPAQRPGFLRRFALPAAAVQAALGMRPDAFPAGGTVAVRRRLQIAGAGSPIAVEVAGTLRDIDGRSSVLALHLDTGAHELAPGDDVAIRQGMEQFFDETGAEAARLAGAIQAGASFDPVARLDRRPDQLDI